MFSGWQKDGQEEVAPSHHCVVVTYCASTSACISAHIRGHTLAAGRAIARHGRAIAAMPAAVPQRTLSFFNRLSGSSSGETALAPKGPTAVAMPINFDIGESTGLMMDGFSGAVCMLIPLLPSYDSEQD